MTDLIARSEKQLGAILRRQRKRSRMTQTQLGEKIHMRQATISKLEDGAPATQIRVLIATLAALDLAAAKIRDHLDTADPAARLRGAPVQPTFSVR